MPGVGREEGVSISVLSSRVLAGLWWTGREDPWRLIGDRIVLIKQWWGREGAGLGEGRGRAGVRQYWGRMNEHT